jgi:hypothetical protein
MEGTERLLTMKPAFLAQWATLDGKAGRRQRGSRLDDDEMGFPTVPGDSWDACAAEVAGVRGEADYGAEVVARRIAEARVVGRGAMGMGMGMGMGIGIPNRV